MDKQTLILLVGPTGVGKTETAIELALRLDGEIVSADSRLFYRGMDIGTAKPSIDDRRRVPHHLIDIADPGETISLAEFQSRAYGAIREINHNRKVPILVGGTGQYISAVTESWKPPQVKPDERLRIELGKIGDNRGSQKMHQILKSMDPEAAEKIEPGNVRRIIRALEVILISGRKFSQLRVHGESPYRLIGIGLNRPRPELYDRIDKRIEQMFQNGLLEEVERQIAAGYSPSLPSMSAIGYKEASRVVNGEWSIDQAIVEMKRRTRIFVRRQANWFKESDPNLHWFYAGDPQLVENIERWLKSTYDHDLTNQLDQ